jgi:biofilm PGA synthesis N-glycosyltransferase PgaC
MRHRAADCKLAEVTAMTRLLGVQLARIDSGALALSASRIDRLAFASSLIARQLDAHFDGHSPDPAAIDDIRATLQAASLVIPQDSAVARRARPQRRVHLSVKTKFCIAIGGALAWMFLWTMMAQPWLQTLGKSIGMLPAMVAVGGIAIIPGFMHACLLIGRAMAGRPAHAKLHYFPPVSILVAAHNSASSIEQTVRSIGLQRYPGKLEVIVVDDGSGDNTAAVVEALLAELAWLRLVRLPQHGGRATALNHALQLVKASLVVTVNAGAYLHHGALQDIVQHFFDAPRNTRAVSGTVLACNARASLVTRVLEWDDVHPQLPGQRTAVAQGAFSLYDRATLACVGGWPGCVGEDIALRWAFRKQGYRVGHSQAACVLTDTPATLGHVVRQRQRWARGMIEGFKLYPDCPSRARLWIWFAYWHLLFPLLDLLLSLCLMAAIALALFGHDAILGLTTLALLPLGLAMRVVSYVFAGKSVQRQDLGVGRTLPGLLVYPWLSSLIVQPACLLAVASELLRPGASRRRFFEQS